MIVITAGGESRPVTGIVVGAVIALLVLAVVLLVALVVRRVVLSRLRGAFECHLRDFGVHGPDVSAPWQIGVGRYEGSRLAFFAAFRLSWWPTAVFERDALSLLDRWSGAQGREQAPSAGVPEVLRCGYDGRIVDLAMDEKVAGGFAIWVESGPPGRSVRLT